MVTSAISTQQQSEKQAEAQTQLIQYKAATGAAFPGSKALALKNPYLMEVEMMKRKRKLCERECHLLM
jgi:hypothetical protein